MGLQSVPTMEALADEALRRMWRFSVNDLMKARVAAVAGLMKKLTGIFFKVGKSWKNPQNFSADWRLVSFRNTFTNLKHKC